MDFGGFHGDFNFGRASNRRVLPDFGSNGFLQSLNANPSLKNQSYSKSSDALDLCKKLNKMGISCDVSIWNRPEPVDFGSRARTLHGSSSGFEQNLSGASRIHDGFGNVSSVSSAFLQNKNFHDGSCNVSSVFLQDNNFHGVSSPGEMRLLGFGEMMAFRNQRDFLLDDINRPIKHIPPPCLRSVSFGNDGFKGSLMVEGYRVSQTLASMEGSRASYTEDNTLMMSPFNEMRRYLKEHEPNLCFGNDGFKGSLMVEGNKVSETLAAMEGSRAFNPEDSTLMMSPFNEMRRYLKEHEPKLSTSLPTSLVSMVKIYGSVNLMAQDQTGCRVLQKLVEEGTSHDAKFIFVEIIDHVVELSMDPFGNYLVQKLIDVSNEEQRTLIVSVLTSKPTKLLQLCLNTYGTRVVQKMIETVTTKQQIEMVQSGLKPSFLSLVNDLNGNHVIQSCLQSLGPNDNKFVLEEATKYCDQIATHRHGCCVLQSCLSNSVGPQHERLVAEISRHSLRLSQDPYGNYVVQYLIEHQVSASKVLVQFRMHYAELATQKFSSHVTEKCLRKYPESRAEIVRELLSVPHFEQLLQDPYANYVIQTALSVTEGAVRERLVEKVYRFRKLHSSPYCKKIFAKTILKK